MALVLAALIGCGRDPGVAVHDREVAAGCGTCVFAMEGRQGCFWAVEIDGRVYPVGGVHPPDDLITAHQPGGMCAQTRRAVVDGEIRPDGRFLATRFELVPLDGTEPEAKPHQH